MAQDISQYVGRFAPSPTGALHAGSLVAALASWLDARAHRGKWLVRIEDVDTPRCIRGSSQEILRQLSCCGLIPDEAPVYQSQRSVQYQAALDQLIRSQAAYPCACSRKDIEDALNSAGLAKPRHGELIYPGTCRSGLRGKSARAWRMNTQNLKPNQHLDHMDTALSAIKSGLIDDQCVTWQDRRLGMHKQNVSAKVGDFVLKRADGLWAYQLAVVVDDATQGITHIVRGEDLADNTARQITLQRALKYALPSYLHTPVVLAADGHKLSKQNGAAAVQLDSPKAILAALQAAAQALQLESAEAETTATQALTQWTHEWLLKYPLHD